MVTLAKFRALALSFPEASEAAHFEKISFRVRGKIFATCDAAGNRATLKLSEKDQDVFSLFDKNIIYPVDNKWGKQGWTFFELKKVKAAMLSDALALAYQGIAPGKRV